MNQAAAVIGAVVLTVSLSHAQEMSTYTVQETVVTATLQETAPENVPQPVTVISREEIVNSPAYNVGDLLDTVPGVSVFRSSGTVGGNNGVSMRSLNGGPGSVKTLVLVDGKPVNDAWNGSVNWLALPVEQVERIEVVRGPGSALYGSRSSGGVISIFTKKPQSGFHGWVSVGHEMNMSEEIDDSKADGYGRPEVSATRIALNGSFGGEKATHLISTGYRKANQSFLTTAENDWDDYDVMYKGNYAISDNVKSDLTLSVHKNTWDSKATSSPSEDIDKNYSADYHTIWSTGAGVLSGRVYLNNSVNDNTVYSSNLQTGTNSKRAGLMADYSIPMFGKGTLISGIDANYNTADVDYAKTVMSMTRLGIDSLYVYNAKTGKSQGYWVEKYTGVYGATSQSYDEYNVALFSQYSQMLTRKMNFIIGGRLDNNSEFGTTFNPKAGITYDVFENAGLKTTVKANVATAFRAPTMWSMFSKSTGSYGNPDQKPEKTKNYDLGIFQRFGKYGTAEVTLYRMDVTDLMVNSKAGRTTDAFYVFVTTDAKTDTIKFSQQLNLGSYNPKGVELGYTVSPHRFIKLRGAYTYLDPGDFTYQTAKNRYNISASGYYPLGSNRIEGEILYNHTGDGFFYDYEQNPHDAFGLTQARVTFCYGDQYRMSLTMLNIGDTKYQYSTSEWQAGRSLQFTIESQF
jgi:outer membrane cobalamin receptor